MLPARNNRTGEKADEDEKAADEFKYPLKTHEREQGREKSAPKEESPRVFAFHAPEREARSLCAGPIMLAASKLRGDP
jgi:hypothetical protein